MDINIIIFIIKVEPYWTVNLNTPPFERIKGQIKVEPYWNVNKLHKNIHSQKSIKVEPYWNVNLFHQQYLIL